MAWIGVRPGGGRRAMVSVSLWRRNLGFNLYWCGAFGVQTDVFGGLL